jgi:tRNA (guanine-N7-)-methyltransferase
MATALPSLSLDLNEAPPDDAASLFPHRPARIVMEIGFGGAEHLIAEAKREPAAGFIGVEPFVAGLAKAVSAIVEQQVPNVRLFGNDAALVLDWLPPQSLEEVDLLYPDPWPKKRHWKRRFVSKENLDRIARALKPGGVFRFASDIPSYVEWTLMHLIADARFAWTAEMATDWTQPYPHWPGTRYEAKALREGRVPTYLQFTRLPTEAPPLP